MSSRPVTHNTWKRLGILAGGGSLPVRVASAEAAAGRRPYIVHLTDDQSALDAYPGDHVQIGELGRVLKVLKEQGCDAVCFAGQLKRPNFASIKADLRGAMLLPKVVSAARKGDGAILDVIVAAFEGEGFQVVGAEDVADQLLLPAGTLGSFKPDAEHFRDAVKASQLIAALGPFDVGQGAVVRNGFVLAIEAAEGTDAMLERCAALPENLKGYEPGQKLAPLGVLLKRPKPNQELRVDLPTIGVQTVQSTAAAGLAGIMAPAERALMIDRDDLIACADELGIFVYGYQTAELKS
ncbi:MAG: UDP-2,3-diacylglucosamine diphosphatase LpxI [Pseudomonadota bacterium]